MRYSITALVIGSALLFAGNSVAGEGKGQGQGAAAREALFEKLDKNKDGFLSKEELLAMPSGTKAKKLEAFMKEHDKDVDGKLSKEEFLAHNKKDNPKKKEK